MKYDWLLKLSNEFLNAYKNKLKNEKYFFEYPIKHLDEEIEEEGYDPKNPNINIDDRTVLLNNDIVPVEPGEPSPRFKAKDYRASDFGHENPLLGAGGFARVVRVIWKGKPAVAKITVAKNDFSKMLNFTKLKDKVPNEFKKHIPIVYDHFFDEKSKRYIFIMEELKPMNIHIKNVFDGKFNTEIFKRRLEKFIQNINKYVENVVKRINSNNLILEENKINKVNSDKIIEFIKNNITKLFKANSDQNLYDLKWKFRVELDKFLINLHLYSGTISKFLLNFDMILIDFTTVRPFPMEHDSTIDHTETVETPELKSLYEFLVYLKDNLGIKWSDMHSGNIMERPGTRDLVVSDPGEFVDL